MTVWPRIRRFGVVLVDPGGAHPPGNPWPFSTMFALLDGEGCVPIQTPEVLHLCLLGASLLAAAYV